jgi:hypothetical protein
MFKVHKDGMNPDPTPERVYSVCRIIADKSISSSELQKAVSVYSDTPQATTEVSASIRIAEELGIIQNKDGVYSVIIPTDIINTYIGFRQYVSDRVFKQKDTTFYKVTEWYLSKNEKVVEYDSWEDKSAAAVQDGIDGIKENDMLGWRFWASFLGEGYLHDRLLIPNMKVRIQDVLATKFKQAYSYEKEISAKEFLTWLQVYIPEATLLTDAPLVLGVSNGLRSLAECGLIVLRAQMDAQRYKLYTIEGEMFNDFSHVIVKEVIANELE